MISCNVSHKVVNIYWFHDLKKINLKTHTDLVTPKASFLQSCLERKVIQIILQMDSSTLLIKDAREPPQKICWFGVDEISCTLIST